MPNNIASGDPLADLIKEFVLAAHGNFDRVRELYQLHPEVLNCKFLEFDENALEAAGHMGRRDIAIWLLDRGAPPTIYAAAMLGQKDSVERFLAEAPERGRRPGVHGFSVLFHAALSGDTEIADILLARGGDVGLGAALHAAVSARHLEMAEWLLVHGAPVNSPNFQGETPLAVALRTDRDAIAELLRRHGGVGTA